MTKIETIRLLLEQNDEIVKMFAETWTDEFILRNWNKRESIDNKGLKLVKIGEEFEVEFYSPLHDFVIESINSLNN